MIKEIRVKTPNGAFVSTKNFEVTIKVDLATITAKAKLTAAKGKYYLSRETNEEFAFLRLVTSWHGMPLIFICRTQITDKHILLIDEAGFEQVDFEEIYRLI